MKTLTKLMLIIISILSLTASAVFEAEAQYQTGDVFVAVSNGQVKWYRNNGTFVQTLNTGQGGFTTGMAIDTASNLYVTNFSANSVSVFDKFGVLVGLFGSGYSTPESILFDGAANAYVGNLGNGIRKYSPNGTFIGTSYNGQVDWMDLQFDQCTMLRDFEGSTIETYNVCTNTAGPTFATGLTQAFALRIIPTGPFTGHVLIADRVNIKRFDATGALQTTYDVSGEDAWFALNLDPDGASFWSADFGTANVYKFNISTGATSTTFNTGTGGNTVFGLCVKGEITAATILFINTQPRFAINPINTQHCVTSTVTDQNGVPQAGEIVDFTVSGCNGTTGSGTTNGSGQVQFCYVGTNACCDTIYAEIRSTGRRDTVVKCWQIVSPVELSAFTSTINRNDVTLNWVTTKEISNSRFEIERKSANGDYASVGSVQGNGTTNSPSNYSFTDRNLNSGIYNYRLKQIDFNGNFEYFALSNEVSVGIPTSFNLSQNYPNPFNPTTKIDFALPTDGNITLEVYDNSGKLISSIVDGFRAAGYYTIDFNGSNLASGVYFYKISYETNGKTFDKTMKMTIVK